MLYDVRMASSSLETDVRRLAVELAIRYLDDHASYGHVARGDLLRLADQIATFILTGGVYVEPPEET